MQAYLGLQSTMAMALVWVPVVSCQDFLFGDIKNFCYAKFFATISLVTECENALSGPSKGCRQPLVLTNVTFITT